MRFWDSSALVPLHIDQARTLEVRALYRRDRDILAWTLSDVEMRSALYRLARDSALASDQLQEAIIRIEQFWMTVHTVNLIESVKRRAKRLLAVHSLRAADSMQLGAALTAVDDNPVGWEFVCLDNRLRNAAQREGFLLRP